MYSVEGSELPVRLGRCEWQYVCCVEASKGRC